jgi:SAM-dependent methyltransferase
VEGRGLRVWTILKFRVIADVGREDAGFTTLRRVEVLKRYNRFLWDLVAPFVGGRVLEIGSGTGLMTKFLAGKTRVTATDIDQDYVQLLSRTFSGNPNVEVRHLDLATLDQTGIPKKRTTRSSARTCSSTSRTTGRAHVDARGAAAGRPRRADRPGREGHLRRDRPRDPPLPALLADEIEEKLRAAGLEVEHLSYFNMLGVPAGG